MKQPAIRYVTTCLVGLIFTWVTSSIADTQEPLQYKGNCLADDTWRVNLSLSPKVNDFFDSSVTGKTALERRFWEAINTHLHSKKSQERVISSFFVWRTALSLGLLHPARDGFVGFLKANKAAPKALREAAFSCLGRMHHDYHRLRFSDEEEILLHGEPNTGLAPEAQEVLSELRIRLFLQHSSSGSGLDALSLKEDLKSLEGSGPYYALAHAVYLMRSGSDLEAARELAKLLQTPLPAHLSKFTDFAHLNLARYEISHGRLSDAARQFSAIPQSSEWFPEAISEKGWTFLNARNYQGALGMAYNEWLPGFNKLFIPDPVIVAAISFLETCHISEARRVLKAFAHDFAPTYHWLGQWHREGAAGVGGLYDEAVKFARGESTIPERIGTEWVHSSVFMVSQKELNTIIDERQTLKELQEDKLPTTVTITEVQQRHLTMKLGKLIDKKEAKLISDLTKQLARMNETMFSRLQTMVADIRLIEIEALDRAGEDKLYAGREGRRPAGADVSISSEFLSFGKRPTFSAGQDEVWTDELGHFRADLKNLCAKN